MVIASHGRSPALRALVVGLLLLRAEPVVRHGPLVANLVAKVEEGAQDGEDVCQVARAQRRVQQVVLLPQLTVPLVLFVLHVDGTQLLRLEETHFKLVPTERGAVALVAGASGYISVNEADKRCACGRHLDILHLAKGGEVAVEVLRGRVHGAESLYMQAEELHGLLEVEGHPVDLNLALLLGQSLAHVEASLRVLGQGILGTRGIFEADEAEPARLPTVVSHHHC